jgi:choline dehydrogenase-like flavoprotein
MEHLGADDVQWPPEGLIGFGSNAHHMGTCRMGKDPASSVVDADLRAHDVPNLFIVGSSVFPTGGPHQPTLTIAALSIRLADHIPHEYSG